MTQKRNFLVIDDDSIFATTLSRSLERRGFEVTLAEDGRAALALAGGARFAGITVDLHLDRESGLKLIEPLREMQPQARILVLTGYASIATAVAAVKLGADDYLAKPANTVAILSAMKLAADIDWNAGDPEAVEVPEQVLSVARLEWEHIQRVLSECEGNVSEAARRLHMHRRTLQRKLAKHPVRQ